MILNFSNDVGHPMTLQATLHTTLAGVFSELGYDPTFAKVVVSGRPELADYQCNGAMPLAKQSGASAPEIARGVVEKLVALGYDASVTGPGFINIRVPDSLLETLTAVDGCLELPDFSTKNVLIDFGGPNVAKTMHVGHLRSAIIGDCLQRLFRFLGYNVTSDIHLGDWGLQMGMVIDEIIHTNRDHTNLTADDLLDIYRAASVRCKTDPLAMEAARIRTSNLQNGNDPEFALWRAFRRISVNDVRVIFDRMGVNFDLWNGESDSQVECTTIINYALYNHLAHESEGALVIPVGDDMPPLILQKSDGAALYGTTDVATLISRVTADPTNYPVMDVLYVVDQRQSLHFKQVFAATTQLLTHMGYAGEKAGYEFSYEHIGFGTINGPDGKPFKTRDGDLVSLTSLLDDAEARAKSRIVSDFSDNEKDEIARHVALAAIKYADLRNDRRTDYAFDLDRFLSFEGRTGPYILYTAVRCKSILRKSEVDPGDFVITNPEERAVALELARAPDVLMVAHDRREPHWLAEHAYKVAAAFNEFYHKHTVVGSDSEASRYTMVEMVLEQLETVCDIMGITIPERM
jgi:arginyl-tRNA synthetase